MLHEASASWWPREGLHPSPGAASECSPKDMVFEVPSCTSAKSRSPFRIWQPPFDCVYGKPEDPGAGVLLEPVIASYSRSPRHARAANPVVLPLPWLVVFRVL